MDADYIESQRDPILSRREKRWSMNSQRLEEIVAELMKPISDVRRSFDTDLCALLEEYLTEAGLHALEAGEAGPSHAAGGGGGGAPNFAELALLLQQSASIYGRKVDFLYQHVIDCSESLHTSTQEIANTSAPEEAETPSSSSRRKRKASASGSFGDIEVEASAAARREAGPARPPPTLPRMYLELAPRVPARADAPLLDYAGESIGLLSDFHVTWRLHEGLLVDELEEGAAAVSPALRPLSLVELQAALEAAAPPLPATPPPPPGSPPPLGSPPPSSPRAPSPLCASTPLPHDPPTPAKRDRKRRSDVKIDDVIGGTVKILISKELRRKLNEAHEFTIPSEWISQLVGKRKSHILSERRRLRAHPPRPPNIEDFRGFDSSDAQDVGGFGGWSSSEAAEASLGALSGRAGEPGGGGGGGGGGGADSDDDGFFEQSSLGDSDASRVEDSPLRAATAAEWAAWQAGVLRRARAQEARGALDVRALGAAVLRALPSSALPFPDVLRAAAHADVDVSRLLLASLFLANAGNVEVIPGAPLSVDSFSLRLLSTDERLYCAAAAAEDGFLR